MNEFFKNFEELFDEPIEKKLKEDTVFRDLDEWDSITALSLIAMLDEKYNVQISNEQLGSVLTLKELFELVS